jgi:plasmid stabilization system protein ParE
MNLKHLEYSQIVRRKLNILRTDLQEEYGDEFSKKVVGQIISRLKQLEQFSDSGVRIAEMYEVDTDYYYVFTNHHYFIYRMQGDAIIVVQMFHEKEDFMQKLFGISERTQESLNYWNEE